MGNTTGPVSGTDIFTDLERVVIGCCLLSEKAALEAARQLEGWEFSDPSCAHIFGAIRSAVMAGAPVDQITVAEYLSRDGRLDLIGGRNALEECVSTAVGAGNPTHLGGYLLAMRQRARVRRLSLVADSLKAIASSREDPQELLGRASRILDDALRDTASATRLTVADAAVSASRWIAARYAGLSPGIPTGFAALDRIIGGLRPGQLVLLAGRTKMGKSAVAGHIALQAAKKGYHVLLVTMEMPAWQWLVRWVAASTGISYFRLMRDQISEEEEAAAIAALQKLKDLPIQFVEDRSIRLVDLKVEARAVKAERRLDLMVVDHIGLLGDVIYGKDPVKDLGDAAKRLRDMAQKLEVPILVISQLSRAVELQGNRRPQLHHLRESGHLEQDADVVVFVYRDSYYYMPGTPMDADTGEPARKSSANVYYVDPHLTELIVAANRDGPPGIAYVNFNPETMMLEDAHHHGTRSHKPRSRRDAGA